MTGGAIQGFAMFAMRPWIGSCSATAARLSGYLEHDLAAREERRVRRHLLRCRRCRAVYQSLVRTVEQVRTLGREDLGERVPSVADLVVERIQRDRE
jgi:predicted anti-sigma-YlaC factor YlaD